MVTPVRVVPLCGLLECDAHSIAVTWRLGSLARCVERVGWSLGLGLVLLKLLRSPDPGEGAQSRSSYPTLIDTSLNRF